MDTTKKLLKNIPEYLLYFLATDLICLLISFAVNAILRPLLEEMTRGDEMMLARMDQVFWIVFAILFYLALAVILSKSSIQRSGYLAATLNEDGSVRTYHFWSDLGAFCKSGLLTGVVAYLIFCLPLTVLVAIFPDISYLPTFFYPQYALIALTSPWVALLLNVIFYAVFAILLFPCLHLYWEKNRLHK